jgi:hypothetical protein
MVSDDKADRRKGKVMSRVYLVEIQTEGPDFKWIPMYTVSYTRDDVEKKARSRFKIFGKDYVTLQYLQGFPVHLNALPPLSLMVVMIVIVLLGSM